MLGRDRVKASEVVELNQNTKMHHKLVRKFGKYGILLRMHVTV